MSVCIFPVAIPMDDQSISSTSDDESSTVHRETGLEMKVCRREKSTLVFIAALLALFGSAHAQFNPCNGKAQLGESCDVDADCENKGSVCLRGSCQCHPHYARVVSEKGASRCSRYPSKIGQDCSTKCREPLFCRNGKCQCVQRGSTSILNGECVSISRVGDRCSKHYVQQGSKCVAASNCPVGGTPSGTCIARAQIGQISNFVEQADTCTLGHYCLTTPDSPIGHCCPIMCPLSSAVDYNYNCAPGGDTGGSRIKSQVARPAPLSQSTSPSPVAIIASNVFGRASGSGGGSVVAQSAPPLLPPALRAPCPSDTHFCHYLAGDSFAQAVCCKRPCNAMAPNSLYLNGECLPRGQLNAECQRHEQCGGAEGMECGKTGVCQCVKDFSPSLDVLTHPTKNPSQLCVRDCDKNSSLSRDTTCLSKTQLGGACFVQEQCPENSGCYRGRCLCRCGHRMTALGKCVPIPVPTTQQPPQQPLVPSIIAGPSTFPGQVPGQFGWVENILGRWFGGGVGGGPGRVSGGRPPTTIVQQQ